MWNRAPEFQSSQNAFLKEHESQQSLSGCISLSHTIQKDDFSFWLTFCGGIFKDFFFMFEQV